MTIHTIAVLLFVAALADPAWAQTVERPPTKHAPPEPSTARWLVRAWRTGGIAGIRQFVSIDADGRLQMTDWRSNPRCTADVPQERLAEIEAALDRSQPDQWRRSYAPPDNPDGCCDQTGHTLYVERNDPDAARRTYETSWFVDATLVPRSVLSLYEMIWNAGKVCDNAPGGRRPPAGRPRPAGDRPGADGIHPIGMALPTGPP